MFDYSLDEEKLLDVAFLRFCFSVQTLFHSIKTLMKHILLSLIGLLAFSAVGLSQLSEGAQSMSLGSKNALVLELPKTDAKDVLKQWKSFANDLKGSKAKRIDKKSGEHLNDNILIKEFDMGNNTVDIYSRVVESGNGSRLTVWFDLGAGFLSSAQHPTQYKAAEKMMYKFALSVSKEMVEDQLKEQKKILKGQEGDFKKLVKNKKKYEDDIEDYKKKIEERENDIKQNLEDQSNKKAEIQKQQSVVKEIEKRLKDLD